MTENFCTLFDSFYLSRGLAMYNSLERVCTDFHIYIFTFDDNCHSIMTALDLKRATLIPLSDFENNRLLNVKESRTKAEYCWTCTSSTIEYVFKKFNVSVCTYLDADLYFFNSPISLISELKEQKNILITEHRYSWLSKLYEEKRAGKYCVQFITFVNEKNSRQVLNHWIEQCIDWCFDRYEDGKFGDQKYLDDWPVLYSNVKVSDNPGAGVAPWNISRYNITCENDILYGIEKETEHKFKIVFYHFHFVRFMENGYIDLGWNHISKNVIKHIYVPYLHLLNAIEKNLSEKFPDYKSPVYRNSDIGVKSIIKALLKKKIGYNMLELNRL
jgi:hypothetical protein